MNGRKPQPAMIVDSEKHKKSKQEIERRKEVERKLKTSGFLRCPSKLSPVAKKEWKRVIKLYREMESNILSDLDKTALTIYCEAYAIYSKAHEVWSKYQQIVSTNEEAQKIIDKTFKTMQSQSQVIYRFSEQLCLTPVGRARMGMAKKQEPSLLERLMMEDEDEE
ncbi:MAG: phage terminase small subunit P27 family [Methanolobus sp.]|nr:phage terminase small subunit P27 family [Methanolobus sp.]